jgi:archaellin
MDVVVVAVVVAAVLVGVGGFCTLETRGALKPIAA